MTCHEKCGIYICIRIELKYVYLLSRDKSASEEFEMWGEKNPTSSAYSSDFEIQVIIYGQIGSISPGKTAARSTEHAPSVPEMPACLWGFLGPTSRRDPIGGGVTLQALDHEPATEMGDRGRGKLRWVAGWQPQPVASPQPNLHSHVSMVF